MTGELAVTVTVSNSESALAGRAVAEWICRPSSVVPFHLVTGVGRSLEHLLPEKAFLGRNRRQVRQTRLGSGASTARVPRRSEAASWRCYPVLSLYPSMQELHIYFTQSNHATITDPHIYNTRLLQFRTSSVAQAGSALGS